MTTVNWTEVLGWNGEQLQELRVAGYGYLTQGVYHRAIIFFEALVSLDPTNVFDLQTLGALHLQVGDGARALEWLNKAIDLSPGDHLPQLNKAKALLMLGRKQQGLALARALSTEHEAPDIRNTAEALVMAYA